MDYGKKSGKKGGCGFGRAEHSKRSDPQEVGKVAQNTSSPTAGNHRAHTT